MVVGYRSILDAGGYFISYAISINAPKLIRLMTNEEIMANELMNKFAFAGLHKRNCAIIAVNIVLENNPIDKDGFKTSDFWIGVQKVLKKN